MPLVEAVYAVHADQQWFPSMTTKASTLTQDLFNTSLACTYSYLHQFLIASYDISFSYPLLSFTDYPYKFYYAYTPKADLSSAKLFFMALHFVPASSSNP